MVKFMSLLIKFTEESEKSGVSPYLSLKDDETGRQTRKKMIGTAKSWLEQQ
jgi:hypothetical protein